MTKVDVTWSDRLLGYDFGAQHPMNPVRLDLTRRLCDALGVLDHARIVEPELPGGSDEFLTWVHDPGYVEAVRAASADPAAADVRRGLGTEDDPAFRGMHEISTLIAAGTVNACERVWTGVTEHAVNFCGGLHHAMADRASGFCIYNDAALGIHWLLEHGAKKVAYVDLDVHHGDGVERIFWNDPRVLTVSIHETGRVLFPGTGFALDVGGPDAQGTAVNISLPPGTGDSAWLRAMHAVIPQVVAAFEPDVLISQQGCDSHYADPLAHFALTVDAQRTAYETIHDLAHEVTGGRWVALGGGGYELVDVVPRAWTHLTAIAAHQRIPLDTAVPQGWLDYVHQVTDRQGPTVMGDGVAEGDRVWWRSWNVGVNPEDPLDHAVLATREAVFPHLGLDIWFD
ncbi:acetoin utilization protein AcuC [Branchiibius hedensis]|uniref:Acetoin utilization protein AcuC n=1 Tax=Branchiibius hedensis TaxID=672460 RepID=A0A2Y8ZSD7_9MICO|nr:acetoin utilization protein AcuC [Branchiibius hedensis]PWJ24019.1 acetoin utilization protein AcuC [Branchiibius hedensis]SSA32837.1 acetoin utilization protein AcuC [Branchiibius hedensis]